MLSIFLNACCNLGSHLGSVLLFAINIDGPPIFGSFKEISKSWSRSCGASIYISTIFLLHGLAQGMFAMNLEYAHGTIMHNQLTIEIQCKYTSRNMKFYINLSLISWIIFYHILLICFRLLRLWSIHLGKMMMTLVSYYISGTNMLLTVSTFLIL